jgi:hypothetical protein
MWAVLPKKLIIGVSANGDGGVGEDAQWHVRLFYKTLAFQCKI